MKVLPFSSDNFANVLIENNDTSFGAVTGKGHFRYFIKYLGEGGINAKTMVVESHYISKDYLHDFAHYYSLCFEDYEKYCVRVHFFANSFEKKEFSQIILTKDQNEVKEFWNNYLGFLVVKPIPYTMIGFTLLKGYSNDVIDANRNFWGGREYKVHVFGVEQSIQSLAFQEQDSVVSACATTAIWSMLNKASINFDVIQKTPSQITNDADETANDGNRLFPNKGLDILQISHAILKSGLVCELRMGQDMISEFPNEYLLSTNYVRHLLNAYSPIGLPIILGIKVPNGPDWGYHAITIVGHNESKFNKVEFDPNETIWKATSIEKCYVHDDQWGPFVRLSFQDGHRVESIWSQHDEHNRSTYISFIAIPVFPKIRISYEDISALTMGISMIINTAWKGILTDSLIWDITIVYSEMYKSKLRESSLEDVDKLRVLQTSMPKYIWVASCYYHDGSKWLEFTFDATNISQAMLGLNVVCYLNGAKGGLHKFIESYKEVCISFLNVSAGEKYVEFLLRELAEALIS